MKQVERYACTLRGICCDWYADFAEHRRGVMMRTDDFL